MSPLAHFETILDLHSFSLWWSLDQAKVILAWWRRSERAQVLEWKFFYVQKERRCTFYVFFSVVVKHSVNHCFSLLQRRLFDWLIPMHNIPPGTFLSACKCKKPILALSVVITFIVCPMFWILRRQFSPEIISEWMWFLFVRSSEQSFFLKKKKKKNSKRRTCCPGLIICFWLVFLSLCVDEQQQQDAEEEEQNGPPGRESDCVVGCCAGDWTRCSNSNKLFYGINYMKDDINFLQLWKLQKVDATTVASYHESWKFSHC